jgi:hypothetical protein
MASAGQTAWVKYFQGRGDIKTTLKKTSPMFDASEPAKKLMGDLQGGTSITYISTQAYEAKALIQYQKGTSYQFVRVPFDNIAKPGVKASGAPSLKPQAFGVLDKMYSMKEYKTTVLSKIDERTDLSPEIKTYLNALFDYYAGGATKKDDVMRLFNKLKASLPINDINKDFGEVIGPVALFTKQLLKEKGITLTTNLQIYVPVRPNEPLMDYRIVDGKRKFTISAKSGTTTNVVKPADIIELLKTHKDIQALKQTKEYKILQILAENSTILGPVRAVAAIYPNLIKPEAARRADLKNFDLSGFAAFINTNDYLRTKKNVTLNEIMYECEKMLQKETKDGMLNMNNIFAKAIEKQVTYVKFQLDASGIGEWGVTAADDITGPKAQTKVYLRSKNGYTRAADKMGIQI